MAENKSPTAKVAAKVEDPSVKSLRGASAYPESTHPPVPPSEQAWRPGRFSYTSADQKPDESTVAQELKSDPMQDEVNKGSGITTSRSPLKPTRQPAKSNRVVGAMLVPIR